MAKETASGGGAAFSVVTDECTCLKPCPPNMGATQHRTNKYIVALHLFLSTFCNFSVVSLMQICAQYSTKVHICILKKLCITGNSLVQREIKMLKLDINKDGQRILSKHVHEALKHLP